jgi:hypothetical protein
MDACCNIPLNRTLFEKMLIYQRVNRKLLLEEEQTTQWLKLTKRQTVGKHDTLQKPKIE